LEVLKYALPLIFTNICYWYVLNVAKFTFQHNQEYINTAIVGTGWLLASSITPFLTVFMFASFPIIVRRFEMQRRFKLYYTNMLQLYCFVFVPLISIFCFYSRELVSIILPEKYSSVALVLPFFTIACFSHELMKLINIKYHLKIKTYIEMVIAGIVATSAYFLNIELIAKYTVLGAGIALFITEFILIITNILTGHKNLDYIQYRNIAKTFIIVSLLGFVYYLALYDINCNSILKIAVYFVVYATTCWTFRKQILS
jgi:O-antigen/teichoic acid export membrane protein